MLEKQKYLEKKEMFEEQKCYKKNEMLGEKMKCWRNRNV